MKPGDIVYLGDGEAAVFIAEGSGEPHDANNVANPDYKPARAARLVAEDFEPGQLFDSPPETPAEAEARAAAETDAANRRLQEQELGQRAQTSASPPVQESAAAEEARKAAIATETPEQREERQNAELEQLRREHEAQAAATVPAP